MILRPVTFPFRYALAVIKKKIGKLGTIKIEPLYAFGSWKSGGGSHFYTNPDGADFQIDGEVMETPEEIQVSCMAKQIRFFSNI